jgi:pyrroline-5-carboxylate reductase
MTARTIAFIGLGNMGGGMAANQAKAGHAVARLLICRSSVGPREGGWLHAGRFCR